MTTSIRRVAIVGGLVAAVAIACTDGANPTGSSTIATTADAVVAETVGLVKALSPSATPWGPGPAPVPGGNPSGGPTGPGGGGYPAPAPAPWPPAAPTPTPSPSVGPTPTPAPTATPTPPPCPVTPVTIAVTTGQAQVVDGGFQEGVEPYSDKPYTIPDVNFAPYKPDLCGNDLLRTVAADSASTANPYISFTATSTADIRVFVIMDTNSPPGWMGGFSAFAQIQLKTQDRPGGQTLYTIYRSANLGKNANVVLGGRENGAALNYFVVVSTTSP